MIFHDYQNTSISPYSSHYYYYIIHNYNTQMPTHRFFGDYSIFNQVMALNLQCVNLGERRDVGFASIGHNSAFPIIGL